VRWSPVESERRFADVRGMAEVSARALRVLLVTGRVEDLKSLGGPLARERWAVSHVRDVAGATTALQQGAFDTLVLALPLPGVEAVGACAALTAVAGCPPIALIDDNDRARDLLAALPSDARPARCLVRPLDGSKLAGLLRELVESEDTLDSSVDRRGLALVMLDLAQRSETGALEVRGGGVTTRLYLRAGVVVSVEGGGLRESLGRMLVRSGVLSERDYERVIRRMTEQLIDNEHQRMGEVLTELGLMSASDVYEALSTQAVEKISACFVAERAELVFHEMSALPPKIEPLAVPPMRALVVDAVRRHFDESELRPLLAPWLGARLKLREDADSAQLQLSREDARVVSALSGAKSVADILRAQPDARPLLSALVLIDAVAPVVPAPKVHAAATPAPRAEVKFAREVVGAARGPASGAAASNAQTQLRFADEAPASGVGQRDESKARLEAEQLFQQARKLLEREKLQEAAAALERCVALRPEEPEYRMYEAWASYLAARVLQRIARAKALACARKMVEADPRAGKPHAILGRLLLEDGDSASAAREFEFALLRDPKDEDAKKGLAQARGPGRS
jgi:tetratricopeptide (TPR) repeat protein